MRVAVLSLTRDRLAYTQHCFQTLREHAGCEFDHFVLDQGSTDGTREWLLEQDDMTVTLLSENVGISRGLNLLLDEELDPGEYDVIVKVDNDCELLTPNTLRAVAALAVEGDALLSPTILGLRNPPSPTGIRTIGSEIIRDVPQIGGVFLAAPASIYERWRFNEHAPLWGTDDVDLCAWWRFQGGLVGYVPRFEANHYLTTDGQVADMPAYFERRVLEGGPAR